jgi:hypothetical protein
MRTENGRTYVLGTDPDNHRLAAELHAEVGRLARQAGWALADTARQFGGFYEQLLDLG